MQQTNKDMAEYYTLVEPESMDDLLEVELLKDEYKGIRYRYEYVNFAKEPNEDGHLPMTFKYDLLNVEDDDIEDQVAFETLLGDIIVDIILKKQRIDAYRKANTKSSDS